MIYEPRVSFKCDRKHITGGGAGAWTPSAREDQKSRESWR